MKPFFAILAVFACIMPHFEEAIAGKILSVNFFSSKSHKITYMPLLEELGKRGHNVTVLTPVPPVKQMKNVNEILLIDMEKLFAEKTEVNLFEMKKTGQQMNPFLMLELFTDLCRKSYDLPVVQSILNDEFDLIFFEPFFNDCVLGLFYRLKAPIVLFSPVGVAGFLAGKVGGHFPPSFHPNLFLNYPDDMNFYQRFVNYGFNLFLDGILRFYFEPTMTNIYREKLGQDIPSVTEILTNQTALILSNGHFSVHRPKPYYPDTVDVGGIHCQPAHPLPKDLEDFIQQGKNGFIYFSMGSGIKASHMPEETRILFLNVFSKLEQQVLWKWETETMPDLPKNVKLSKWLPQQDLLGHRNITMFITHCGGGSTEEAIYHGTPLLGLPFFGDQPFNARLAKEHGFIVELDWNTITEDKLMSGIQEILNNPMYTSNVKQLSSLYKDQPDNPLQRAVYWVEYVMRHKGAFHLRSGPGRKLNFFQYHSYDIILTYIGLIGLVLYFMCYILRFIARKLCCAFMKSNEKAKRE